MILSELHDNGFVGCSQGVLWDSPLPYASQLRETLLLGEYAAELKAPRDEVELEQLGRLISADPEQLLARTAYVSLHSQPGFGPACLPYILPVLDYIESVIVHPDKLADEGAFDEVAEALGGKLVFENMDARHSDYRSAAELDQLFERAPQAGLCLDVAHVASLDPSMELGFELVRRHGKRLRQLHVSGITAECYHRKMTAEDLCRYAPLLAKRRVQAVPWIAESLVDLLGRDQRPAI